MLPLYQRAFTLILVFEFDGKKIGQKGPPGSQVLKIYLGLLGFTFISGVAPFGNTMARRKAVSFCDPITETFNTLFIKNPSQTFNFAAYVEPMHYLAWIFVIVFCLLTPPFLYITTK